MLREVLDFIHNWFIKEPHTGSFEISGGILSPLDFLLEGQRFRVVGSVLNDGLYTYHAAGIKDGDDKTVTLKDEAFNGTICALAVPRDVIALADEIGAWVDTYGTVVNSPYKSESFGGYSYEKTANSLVGDGSSQALSWMDVFGKRLNQWRKLC